jgi:hypothetical protein
MELAIAAASFRQSCHCHFAADFRSITEAFFFHASRQLMMIAATLFIFATDAAAAMIIFAFAITLSLSPLFRYQMPPDFQAAASITSIAAATTGLLSSPRFRLMPRAIDSCHIAAFRPPFAAYAS